MYRYLLTLAAGDEPFAREVMQAVVLKWVEKLRVFDDEGALWAWMRTVARNTLIDLERVRRRYRDRFSEEPGEALVAIPEGADDAILSHALRRALDNLSTEDAELVRTVYLDRRSIDRVAKETGRTYKALESYLFRLRQKLKTSILQNLSADDES